MCHAAIFVLALSFAMVVAAPLALPKVLHCSAPQQRSFPAQDLVRGHPGELLYPPYAVLHRCDDASGSCLGPLCCVPKSTQDVKLVFRVTNVVKGTSDRESFLTVTATNHTACQCAEPSER